jgi:magnesium transporter
MITAYYWHDNNLVSAPFQATDKLPAKVVWIDIIDFTAEEEVSLETQLGIEILTREEIWKNQVLNRNYTENSVSYMTAALIKKVDTPHPEISPVTFILSKDYLITLRNLSPTSFRNFAQRILHHPHSFTTGPAVLEGLLEEIITRVGFNSENVVDQLDMLSHDIFDPNAIEKYKTSPSGMMKQILRRLGGCADLNSKINESLHSIARLLAFFSRLNEHDAEMNDALSILTSDVRTLSYQTAFLSDKITFQLDATLGMINVEQNSIIKIFSVVAVFFLPPTLVSSIYGMNFKHMPELDWITGYPIAISIMLLCALVPFVYFKRKGWL